MWSYRLVAPYTFERQEISEPSPESLADGQVLLDFLAAHPDGRDGDQQVRENVREAVIANLERLTPATA